MERKEEGEYSSGSSYDLSISRNSPVSFPARRGGMAGINGKRRAQERERGKEKTRAREKWSEEKGVK